MGWNIDITTNKPMTEDVIEEIIAELPENMKHGFGKQKWGWSLGVDVKLRDSLRLELSGSYACSGKIAEGTAEAFARRLERRGYRADVSDLS